MLTAMKFLWLPCLLWLLVACSGSSRAMLSRDGLALLDFKSLITLDPSGRLRDWNDTDVSPCGWTGVTCVPSGAAAAANASVVWALNLTRAFLGGSLSGSLGSLANLTRLGLGSSSLTGAIPEEIVNCKLLMYLDLSGSSLEGSLPANMSQLRRLEHLDLSKNSLSGPIPALTGLTNLTYLDLTGNDFVGDIDAIGLSKLTKLEVLRLHDNQFTGSWPNLSGLKNLRTLSSNGNLAPGEVPDLSASQDLQFLRMEGAQLEGPLPTWIGNLPRLEILILSSNNLSGEIPPGMRSNSSPTYYIDLSGNRIGGAMPGDFLQAFPWGGSNELNLSGNRLTGSIPAMINANVSFSALDLSNNELDGPIPTWIRSLSTLSSLYLQNNLLSGDIASGWSNVNQPRAFPLIELELQGNQLSGNVGAATCASWKTLARLDLSHNAGVNLVNDSLELMLSNFSDLQEIRLSNIGSTGRLPLSLMTTARLRTIESNLKVLDLSYSSLEGDLDLSILANAHVLFTKLQSLNLSGNRLKGHVPPSLAVLPYIEVLDLSNNRLSGPLPAFPPHLLNASFFAGNPGLCGPPLKPCQGPPKQSLVLPLALALVGCVMLFAVSCILFAWRLRKSNLRHQHDAELIAAMQGKNSANLMPLAELRKATSNFSNESQIGVGGFGTVHKGKLNDGTTVAIKRSKRQGSQQDKDQFLNEVHILSHVNHRNLVRLLGCCLENKEALLVFEYVPGGTLQEHLRDLTPAPLTWEQRLRIALHTADALAYLNSAANPPIFHRDVKSANILLDEDMNAKVADFGISKLAPLDATHVSTKAVQGTMGYIDPEYYTSFQLSAKSDVYSFGVVLLELISALAPVDFGRDPEEAGLARFAVSLICRGDLRDIVDPAIAHTFDNSHEAKESIAGVAALAVKCLQPRSRDRPSMKEVSKELQTLWLQLVPTVSGSADDHGQQGSSPVRNGHDIGIHGAFLSEASLLASYKSGR